MNQKVLSLLLIEALVIQHQRRWFVGVESENCKINIVIETDIKKPAESNSTGLDFIFSPTSL
jgi:hypothetical protein